MEIFAEIAASIFVKYSIFDVWKSTECTYKREILITYFHYRETWVEDSPCCSTIPQLCDAGRTEAFVKFVTFVLRNCKIYRSRRLQMFFKTGVLKGALWGLRQFLATEISLTESALVNMPPPPLSIFDHCILTGRALKLILHDASSNFILNIWPVQFFWSVK